MVNSDNRMIRVLLVDDHQVVREGLRALFETEKDIVVVAEADNGRTAHKLALELEPDIVVMDMGMPGLNGVDATRKILERMPDIRVIALSIHCNRLFVVEALKAGASGYLVKDCAFEELIRAIRVVMAGQSYLSPEITGILVEDVARRPEDEAKPRAKSLSGREREVLQLLAEGNSARKISNMLHISVQTVNTHRQHIMRKLDLGSVAELTKFAIREGLTSVDS
ncbi:MAG: response regulator transcription factor [Acidobacteriota bacterium]